LSVETYIDKLVPILQRRGFADRTYIQSFDWRTLIGIKKRFSKTRIVALLDPTTIVPSSSGQFPWLGGIDVCSPDIVGESIMLIVNSSRKISAVIGSRLLTPLEPAFYHLIMEVPPTPLLTHLAILNSPPPRL
jgi:hypothetical protein